MYQQVILYPYPYIPRSKEKILGDCSIEFFYVQVPYLRDLFDDVGHAKRCRTHRFALQSPRFDVGVSWLRLEGLRYLRDENCKPSHRFDLIGFN